VAPPCDMEYFNSANRKKGFEYRKGFVTHEDMADAISLGLNKKKPEEKQDSEDDSD
jgi:hypothetical protein